MPIIESLGEVASEAAKDIRQSEAANINKAEIESEFSPDAFEENVPPTKDVVTFPMSYDELNTTMRDVALPDDMVMNAISRACEFFGLPEVPVYNAESVCVWPSDNTTFSDDAFGFNREQLMDMGVRGEDSLTLVYTHECAHRALQGRMTDAWKEELACDCLSGFNAGLNNINLDNVEAALGSTEGGTTHPHGALRAQFIEEGRRMAQEMQANGEQLTFENCMAKFEQYFSDKSSLIAEYRDRFDPYYFSLDANMSETTIDDSKGFVNDKDWHLEEARKATERGDIKAAKDHISSANMCSK